MQNEEEIIATRYFQPCTMAQLQDEANESNDPLLRLFILPDCTGLKNEWVRRKECLLYPSPGYCVISSVLTNQECSDAIDRIWEFIRDTTYGEVRRENPNTWSILWPRSPRETNDVDDCCHFRCNGAGFLLSNIHEILADRVFSLLFGTQELHSSKEGFLFRPSRLNAVTDGHTHGKDVLTQTSCTSWINSTRNRTDMPLVRAMIALEDHCGAPSFVCCIKRVDENSRNRADLNLSNPRESDLQDEMEFVSLKKGDVLIWRSDLIYSFVDPGGNRTVSSQRPPMAALVCSMQPAISTPVGILPMKIEAYKQRQTGTFSLDKEQWITSSSDSIQQNPYHSIRTRQFFRTGPPLVTMQQAQLYGLVPYSNGTDLDSGQFDKKQRSLIQGVRFLESDELPVHAPLVSTRSESKMNEAHLVHLTTRDPADMIGQDKYLGGMTSPCGKYVYGVPGSARQVLRIRVSDGHMDLIGPIFEGKFKWLRGVDVTSSTMNNDPRYPEGCCLALPCNAASVLKINPSTNHVYAFGEDVLKHCGSDRWHYHGGAVATNGWLYAIPANANRVVKIHPVTDAVVYMGPTFSGGQKWFGGITGSDGCIYGIPHNEQSTYGSKAIVICGIILAGKFLNRHLSVQVS
jgi:hypothetical protein